MFVSINKCVYCIISNCIIIVKNIACIERPVTEMNINVLSKFFFNLMCHFLNLISLLTTKKNVNGSLRRKKSLYIEKCFFAHSPD
jgi:hypothetical protein